MLKLKNLLKKSNDEGVKEKEIKNPVPKVKASNFHVIKHLQCQNGFIFEKLSEAGDGGITDTEAKTSECHSELIVERNQIVKSGPQSTETKKWQNLLKMVDSNVEAALTQGTKGKYKYWWCRIQKFCKEYNRQCLPFSELTAAAFFVTSCGK